MINHIISVWIEVESSGADDPTTERGELFYAQGLWSSSSSSSGWGDSIGFGDGGVLLGQSLTASEEAQGETDRMQAVREFAVAEWFCFFALHASTENIERNILEEREQALMECLPTTLSAAWYIVCIKYTSCRKPIAVCCRMSTADRQEESSTGTLFKSARIGLLADLKCRHASVACLSHMYVQHDFVYVAYI